MFRIYLSIFLFGLALPLISARENKFFRKDYTYFQELDAFYKVHWDVNGNSWDSAFLACTDEEANLFYPKHAEEWDTVKVLMDNMKEQPNVTDIFVGFHNKFNLGEYITVDGDATPYPLLNTEVVTSDTTDQCILMDKQTEEFRISQCLRDPNSPLPFICKKKVVSCPTVDDAYKYSKMMRRCYKVNKTPKLWSQAMHTCFMEGGMLIIAETSQELFAISQLDQDFLTYHSGFYNLYPHNKFYTVAGLQFKGEVRDRNGNVINFSDNDQSPKYCGAIKKDGNITLTVESCDAYLPFICQMELSKN